MGDFDKKTKSKPRGNEFTVPPLCGVAGCTQNTVVYFKHADISQCAVHYQDDVDRAGKSCNPRAAQTMTGMPRIEEPHAKGA